MRFKPLIWLDEVDSTNEELKRRARAGAAEGLTLAALSQTGGKGRLGRSFQSLRGKGLYLSVLLRPQVSMEVAARFTPWAAVAVCRALEAELGLSARIKWPNDILVNGKKLCGILTEATAGAVIVGIGVNLTQTAADFGGELEAVAVSLAQLGFSAERETLAAAILRELEELYARFPHDGSACRAEFIARCATLNRPLRLEREGRAVLAHGVDIDENFGLVVDINGHRETVTSGEVSVRGLLGYGQ